MTDDERKLLLLIGKFMVSPIGTANTRLDDIADLVNKIDTKAAPKPPKFPIGSRVVVNSSEWSMMPPRTIGVVLRRDVSGLFLVRVDNGCSVWVHPDRLTAVKVEEDALYRGRILMAWHQRNPIGMVCETISFDIGASFGTRLDAYGADLGIIRRGTEGAKK